METEHSEGETMRHIGIDLAGLPKNDTGFCSLENKKTTVKTLKEDESIINEIDKFNPDTIGIDGPLSKPRNGKLRDCDKKLKRNGALSPVMSHGMKKLTERAIKISKELEDKGYKVKEILPSATANILGLKRKKGKEKRLQKQMIELGLKGTIEKRMLSIDELDSILAALTMKLDENGKTKNIGNSEEGVIIIPK